MCRPKHVGSLVRTVTSGLMHPHKERTVKNVLTNNFQSCWISNFETKNAHCSHWKHIEKEGRLALTRHCICLQQFGQRIKPWPLVPSATSILHLFVAGGESANRFAHKGKSRAVLWICEMKFVANFFIAHAHEMFCSLLLICMNRHPGSLKDMPKEHGKARARLTKAPNLIIAIYLFLVVENQSKKRTMCAQRKANVRKLKIIQYGRMKFKTKKYPTGEYTVYSIHTCDRVWNCYALLCTIDLCESLTKYNKMPNQSSRLKLSSSNYPDSGLASTVWKRSWSRPSHVATLLTEAVTALEGMYQYLSGTPQGSIGQIGQPIGHPTNSCQTSCFAQSVNHGLGLTKEKAQSVLVPWKFK